MKIWKKIRGIFNFSKFLDYAFLYHHPTGWCLHWPFMDMVWSNHYFPENERQREALVQSDVQKAAKENH